MDGEVGFLSFNKKSDWEKGWAVNLLISDDGLLLRKTEKYAASRIINLKSLAMISKVTDFAIGKSGQLYLQDDHANLFLYDYQNEQIEPFFEPDHGLFTKHATIAYMGDTIYLADPAGEGKVLAVSASNGQVLWSINNYKGSRLLPLAMAIDERRNINVVTLLEDLTGNNGDPEASIGTRLVVLKINLSGEVVGLLQNKYYQLTQDQEVLSLSRKVFAAGAKDGFVYVLDTKTNSVFGFSEDEALSSEYPLLSSIVPSGFGIDSNHHIYIGDCRKIGLDAEEDRFILKLGSLSETPVQLHGYRGRTDKLLLDQKNRLYIWNGENCSITVLELKQKILEMDFTGQPQGFYLSTSIDSTVTEMQWHKLLLDADLPENTQLKVSYFSSDHKTFMLNGRLTDLDECIKDEAVYPHEKIKALDSIWSEAVVNPKDALLHGARGRYLWIKIAFTGSEEKTPVLKKIRIYYPRTSYLRYLPAVYQEDKQSRDFLERYLSLFEAFFSDMEEKVGEISRYFDVETVSGPFLKWLATWLAISVDDSWSEEQLKQLLRRSPELYKKRGTKQGIMEMVEIYTGEKPIIIEYFQYKHLREVPGLKELVEQLYGTDPYRFCVLVKQACIPTARRHLVLQQLLNQEKPVFTEAKLVVLQPWIYMDMHTYLGVNTYLSELSLLCLNQESSIPYNTVLIDVDLDNRVGIHTRMGLDAEVK